MKRIRNFQFNSKIKYFINRDGHNHFVNGAVEAGAMCPPCSFSWLCHNVGNVYLFIVRGKKAAMDFTFGRGGCGDLAI